MEEIIGVDKIFVMDKGKLVMEGTPREVFSEVDKLTELGLTVPEATLIGKKLYDSGLPISLPVLTKEELVSEIGRARLSKFR
jgi:ABC-type multidrug transport system ATPase subunit